MSDENPIDPHKHGWRTSELATLGIVVVLAMWVFWRYGAATQTEPLNTARDTQRNEFRQLAETSANEADAQMHLGLGAAMENVAQNLAPALEEAGGATKTKSKPDKIITLTAFNDLSKGTMQFDKPTIEVKTGQRILIILKNTNGPTLPKAAMGHNLVILNKGESAVNFGASIAATANLANEFVPEAAKDKVFAHSKLLGPGETDEMLFTAPAPGEYEFLCTFTGHFALMRGKLIVKE